MSCPGRSRWIISMEAAAVAGFAVLLSVLEWRTVSGIASWLQVLAFLAAAPVGYLLADFFSGLLHWFCDSFFEESMPGLGPMIIAPFREHHRDPLAMTHHGFLELNGNNCLALIPLLAWGSWRGGAGAAPAFVGGLLIFLAIAIFGTNQFHYWAHAPNAPRLVRWLQARGVILSPAHHARHHCIDHIHAYCVTTGWMNRILDGVGFFRGCERLLGMLGLELQSERIATNEQRGRQAEVSRTGIELGPILVDKPRGTPHPNPPPQGGREAERGSRELEAALDLIQQSQ